MLSNSFLLLKGHQQSLSQEHLDFDTKKLREINEVVEKFDALTAKLKENKTLQVSEMMMMMTMTMMMMMMI